VQPLWPSDTQHGGPIQQKDGGMIPEEAEEAPPEGAGGCHRAVHAMFFAPWKVVPLPVNG
jgi:hypothetical protein